MMNSWYDNLNKPPFTLPNKVFVPVWAVIYLLIFVSLVLYILSPYKPYQALTFTLLVIHFTANFSWTPLFFGRKKILPALFDILLIDTTLAAIIVLFLPASTLAAILLLPYLCWGIFATYLNWGIYRLNR